MNIKDLMAWRAVLCWEQGKHLNVQCMGTSTPGITAISAPCTSTWPLKQGQCVRLPVDKLLLVQRANAGFPVTCSADAIWDQTIKVTGSAWSETDNHMSQQSRWLPPYLTLRSNSVSTQDVCFTILWMDRALFQLPRVSTTEISASLNVFAWHKVL